MRILLRWTLAVATTAALGAPAGAQTPSSLNGLGDVILHLSRVPTSVNQQHVFDQLFSGRIDATIIDSDGNNTNFEDGDIVAFGLASISRSGAPLIFSGTRGAFDNWVETNADAILAILFPGSLTESASGIDVAQGHAQAFLVSTALAAGGRGNIGGRIEFERFDVEGSSGNAVQGLFRKNAFGVELRYSQLSDTIHTRATSGGVNYHPSWGRGDSNAEVRIGGDGYFNLLYSTSRAVDLGSFDYGGGVWASGRKEVSKASLSFGGVLLGSKTHIPLGLIDDDFEFVARSINDRTIRWDLTYGGAVQYPLHSGWSVGGKALQSVSVKSPLNEGRTSQLLLADLAYLLGGDTAIDFGYRYSKGGERYGAHGFFMNANFGF